MTDNTSAVEVTVSSSKKNTIVLQGIVRALWPNKSVKILCPFEGHEFMLKWDGKGYSAQIGSISITADISTAIDNISTSAKVIRA